jgi:hypothetical protein
MIRRVGTIFESYRFYWWYARPLARRELAHWRARADVEVDTKRRQIAVGKLDQEAVNIEAASFFAALAGEDWRLAVRRIVAFQVAYEYLDGLSEREPVLERGLQLHAALIEATGGPKGEHRGGGYLSELARCCRETVSPSPELIAAAERLGAAQAHNHADELYSSTGQHPSWEEEAAAISSLDVLAMLAAPARHHGRIALAYWPMCALSALLDGVIDRASDESTGNHNWTVHYRSDEALRDRLRVLAREADDAINALPGAPLHRLLLAGLLAHNLAAGRLTDAVRSPFAWTTPWTLPLTAMFASSRKLCKQTGPPEGEAES